MVTPTREQLLVVTRDFERFMDRAIRAERWWQRGMVVMLCFNVALVVWSFPVENWLQVTSCLLSIAASVFACDGIKRSRSALADWTEAREQARRTIEKLGA